MSNLNRSLLNVARNPNAIRIKKGRTYTRAISEKQAREFAESYSLVEFGKKLGFRNAYAKKIGVHPTTLSKAHFRYMRKN